MEIPQSIVIDLSRSASLTSWIKDIGESIRTLKNKQTHEISFLKFTTGQIFNVYVVHSRIST